MRVRSPDASISCWICARTLGLGVWYAGAEAFSAHSRESGNPELWPKNWVPAFAGTSGRIDESGKGARMAEAAVQQAAQKAFPVSWDQFHRDARALAWRLSSAGPFESIVCVTRGGLVPAAIVARELE